MFLELESIIKLYLYHQIQSYSSQFVFPSSYIYQTIIDTKEVMSSARTYRLLREIKGLETQPPWGITCKPDTEAGFDILHVKLCGPKSSPYEGGVFELVINVPERYPFEPPVVKFVTPVYHPNIDKAGRICMNMLKMPPKGSWLPTITIETLLISVQALLSSPNPDDPLMMDLAYEYKYDITKFLDNAKKHTEKYATLSLRWLSLSESMNE